MAVSNRFGLVAYIVGFNWCLSNRCCNIGFGDMITPTKAEKAHWDKLCRGVGCVACLLDGDFNPKVSVHHTNGRTKPGCHMEVFPLCAGHHQDGTEPGSNKVAIHPWKRQFESMYGTQSMLVAICRELIGELM